MLRLLIVCGLFAGSFLFAQTPNEDLKKDLKSFLENKSFPELLNEFKQETIQLTVTGRQERSIARRPYHMQDGYRCQVFAGTSLQKKKKIANQLKALNLDSVYVLQDESLFKVQVGNFQQRTDAEALLTQLQNAGYSGAWIIEGDVRVAKSEAEQQAIAEQENKLEQQFSSEQNYYYAIQVMATVDSEKAKQLSRDMELRTQQPVQAAPQGSIWKVLVGKFNSRTDAEQLLRELKKGGFNDAWVTQISSH